MEPSTTNKKRHYMSKQQYNLKLKTDYLNRKMFLDPAVTSQAEKAADKLLDEDCEACKL